MKKLFAFVMVGSNDLNKSGKFYDAVAIYLGIIKVKLQINIFVMPKKYPDK